MRASPEGDGEGAGALIIDMFFAALAETALSEWLLSPTAYWALHPFPHLTALVSAV
jgi:hypothetical protein